MNHIHNLRYYVWLSAKKQPCIYDSDYGSEYVWEHWNMLLKYGAENKISKKRYDE